MVIDPRLQILYLLAVGIVAFATADPWWLSGLLGLQILLWLWLRLPLRGLLAIVRRLQWFVGLVVLSFAFFAFESGDRLVALPVWRWALEINLSGIVRGLLLSSRIVTVICASQLLQRAGDRETIVRGLRGLFVPASIAYSLDLVLSLLGTEGPRRGRGRGDGKGRDERAGAERASTVEVFRQLIKGDVGFLVELMRRSIASARERAEAYGLKPEAVSDLAVITGLGVLTMTVRFLKVLPGLPFAPGHKGIVLLPFYIIAYDLTASRWGATQLGVVIGVTSFLMGEGKFGPFEILRHIAPGVFVDLVMPAVRRLVPEPGAFIYALVGTGAALMRVSTLLAVAYFVEAPKLFYAFLVPIVITNTVFGFLSGFVTFHLMKSVQKLRSAL
jgi:hypothetical protein